MPCRVPVEAASAGVPATDTVKTVDTSRFVESTTERGRTWLAQTPQVFRVPIYRAAAYACRDEGFRASDDNAMVEHLHIPVRMVQTHKENIKITEPIDLVLAQAVLEARRAAAARGEQDALPDDGVCPRMRASGLTHEDRSWVRRPPADARAASDTGRRGDTV